MAAGFGASAAFGDSGWLDVIARYFAIGNFFTQRTLIWNFFCGFQVVEE
jgi:hypothetical protein